VLPGRCLALSTSLKPSGLFSLPSPLSRKLAISLLLLLSFRRTVASTGPLAAAVEHLLPRHLIEAVLPEVMDRVLDPAAGGLDLGVGGRGHLGDGEEVRESLDGALHVAGICLGNGCLENFRGTEDEEFFDHRGIRRNRGDFLRRNCPDGKLVGRVLERTPLTTSS
jgi:hypothetical protein